MYFQFNNSLLHCRLIVTYTFKKINHKPLKLILTKKETIKYPSLKTEENIVEARHERNAPQWQQNNWEELGTQFKGNYKANQI